MVAFGHLLANALRFLHVRTSAEAAAIVRLVLAGGSSECNHISRSNWKIGFELLEMEQRDRIILSEHLPSGKRKIRTAGGK